MRLQVMVNDDMVKRIDAIANSLGVSRSAFCAMLIGSGVLNYEKAFEAVNQLPPQMVDMLKAKFNKLD